MMEQSSNAVRMPTVGLLCSSSHLPVRDLLKNNGFLLPSTPDLDYSLCLALCKLQFHGVLLCIVLSNVSSSDKVNKQLLR